MKTYRRMAFVVAALIAAEFCSASDTIGGEPGFNPEARAKAVAPFVDEQTALIVHIDLTRVEPDAIIDKVTELIPEMSVESDEARQGLKLGHKMTLDAGVREVFIVMRLDDFPDRPPLIVIPAKKEVQISTVRKMLGHGQKDVEFAQLNGAWCIGTPERLESVKKAADAPLSVLPEAFKTAGDTLAQLIVVPPRYSRRVIEEMMPELPDAVGGGPSTIITRGLKWAAVGVNAPPRTSFRIVIQSEDHEAATQVMGKWIELVRFLSKFDEARKTVPNIDKVAAMLTPTVSDDRVVLNLNEEDGSIDALFAAVTPPLEQARARARRQMSANNLKQIALAMHNYHDVKKNFPPVGSTDADGKPLLSWRVHILPYIEQAPLHRQFRLDESWDSEHNLKLVEKMPEVFRCPASKLPAKKGLSTYRVVSGEGTVFPVGRGVSFKDIPDGTSNTVMVVEASDEHAATWTKPEGMPFDPDDPARGMGGHFEGGFNAAWSDGSVRFIADSIDKKILRLLLTRNDGQPIPQF